MNINFYQISETMNNLLKVFTILLISLFLSKFTYAQELTKAEQKELKAELKSYKRDLESFKAFKDAKIRAEGEVSRLNQELDRIKALESDCATSRTELRQEIEELRRQLAACQAKPKSGIDGIVYVVQIGAFENNVPIAGDQRPIPNEFSGGFSKYVVGAFRSIEEADQVRDFITQLDFQSNPSNRPFVVVYRDGQRITMEEALGPEEAERRRQAQGQ